VPGDEGDGRRGVAVSHGDSRVGRRGHAGGHARNDLEGYAGGGQSLGLLAAAPEHERISALEANDALAVARQLHEQRVDLILLHRRCAGFLADVAQLGVRPRAGKGAGRDEPVVEDRVGGRDQLE
jgi:hypothetical protein